MTRVLLIGQVPESVDFDDPDLPPSATVESIKAGLQESLQAQRDRGWDADQLLVMPDETSTQQITDWLSTRPAYDVVVIGAGIRLPSASMLLFERIINAVHSSAPDAAIAFNTNPGDTPDAADRWLG